MPQLQLCGNGFNGFDARIPLDNANKIKQEYKHTKRMKVIPFKIELGRPMVDNRFYIDLKKF